MAGEVVDLLNGEAEVEHSCDEGMAQVGILDAYGDSSILEIHFCNTSWVDVWGASRLAVGTGLYKSRAQRRMQEFGSESRLEANQWLLFRLQSRAQWSQAS